LGPAGRGVGGFGGGHDFIEFHGAGGDPFFIGDVGIGGDEVIAAIDLHAVAAVVEEGDAAGGLEAFLKGAEGIEHLLAVGILDKGDLKANLAEGGNRRACAHREWDSGACRNGCIRHWQ